MDAGRAMMVGLLLVIAAGVAAWVLAPLFAPADDTAPGGDGDARSVSAMNSREVER